MWPFADFRPLPCLLAAILLGIALDAAAGRLRLGGLVFAHAEPWQRAAPAEETQAEGYILRLGDSLSVLLPHHQATLKLPEERFYEQLETRWRAQYGAALSLDWVEAAGRRWRLARRPSVEHADRVVFHLVTVVEGRAHHLLAYAPAETLRLPAEVQALLAGVSLPGGGWVLERSVQVLPRGAALEALADQEAAALAGAGGVTGYAVERREHGLAGFLEGFRWVRGPDGRERRQPLLREWDLSWSGPAAAWAEGGALALQARNAGPPPAPALRLQTRLLCGPPPTLAQTLERLEHGEAGAESLDELAAACGVPAGQLPEGELDVGQANMLQLVLPPRLAPGAQTPGRGGARRLVLSVQPRVAQSGRAWGERLLGALAVHYVYAPEGGD